MKEKINLLSNIFLKDIHGAFEMNNNISRQDAFNDEMVRKTWQYQKKYGFEINPKKGNDFWDVEADAFKHAFGSAVLYFRYGDWGSTIAGIMHENKTENNPRSEWNMDSWNNNQGRKIAREIVKEYGKDFYDKNPEMCEKIIAAKVVTKIRNGELINHPDDKRKYLGLVEHLTKKNVVDYKSKKGTTTGQAAPVSNFTESTSYPTDFSKQETPKTASQKMSDAIRAQYYSKMERNNQILKKIFGNHFNQTGSGQGHWVTIKGTHVFIEE